MYNGDARVGKGHFRGISRKDKPMKKLETRAQALKKSNSRIDGMIKRGTYKRNYKKYEQLCREQYVIWKANRPMVVLA